MRLHKEEILPQEVKGLPALYNKKIEMFLKEIYGTKCLGEVEENLEEAAVCRRSGINLKENTRGGVL